MELIIALVTIGFLFWIASVIINAVPMFAPFKTIIMGVLAFIAVIYLLRLLQPIIGPLLSF
jgi:VIT1/CCC1 family predicted Fe2+/Mn2+ transporter